MLIFQPANPKGCAVHRPARFWGTRFALWLTLFSFPALSATGSEATSKSNVTLEGKLVQISDAAPVLKSQGKDYPLSATTPWVFHTLHDKRLANRTVRMEGTVQPDGTFRIERFYTVRGGKLYRVRYFCDVCNIEALEPGDCVCCQEPTEFQEIPVSETNTP